MDREMSLMDKGMKARLKNFSELLPYQNKITADTSDREDTLKPVASHGRPSKGDEMSFGKSFAISGSGTIPNLTISRRSGETKRSIHHQVSTRLKDPSPHKFVTQLEPFCLPTPPHSDASCDESFNSRAVQFHVAGKEESHFEKSVWEGIGKNHDIEDALGPQLYFYKKKNCQRLEDLELTDKSSDSYVPKLLNLHQRTSKRPVTVSSYPHRGVAYHKTKGRIPSPYQSDSSSDSEPSRDVHRVRSAWDRKSHRKNIPQEEMEIIVNRTAANPKTATKLLLSKPRASILKKKSLPKSLDSDNNNMQYSSVSPVKRRTWSESNYQSSSFHGGSPARPTHVVTERLLRANQGDLPSSQTHSPAFKRSIPTPEPTPSRQLENQYSEALEKPSGKEIVEGQTSLPSSKRSKEPHHGEAHSEGLQFPSKQTESPSLLLSSKQSESPSEANQLGKKPQLEGVHSRDSEVGLTSSKRRTSQIVSEVFRHRSVVGITNQPEIDNTLPKKEKNVKNKSCKNPVSEGGSTHTESSAISLVSALRKIAPTKKRVFNVDVGQGINVVTYLKESAPGANAEKQRKLVDLLVTPLEAKKATKKPSSALPEEPSDGEIAARVGDQQSSRSASTVLSSSQQMNTQVNVNTDGMPLKRTNFKTLDQIFKEAHGINWRNTPAVLVENEYEHGTKKRQQLTKHRLGP